MEKTNSEKIYSKLLRANNSCLPIRVGLLQFGPGESLIGELPEQELKWSHIKKALQAFSPFSGEVRYFLNAFHKRHYSTRVHTCIKLWLIAKYFNGSWEKTSKNVGWELVFRENHWDIALTAGYNVNSVYFRTLTGAVLAMKLMGNDLDCIK